MRWVLQDHADLYSNTDAIADALTGLGIPFSWADWPAAFDDDDPPFVYGGVKFVEMANALGYFVYHIPAWDPLNLIWGDHLLNQGAEVLPFSWAPKAASFFIKPISQNKAFNGVVCTWEQYSKWRNQVSQGNTEGYYNLTMDTEVLVNRVIEISKEYRFFVLGAHPITGSLYRDEGGRRDFPFFDSPWFSQPVLDYCLARIEAWPFPCRPYVLDIVELPTGELKILEVNCVNSSGLYACDANKIVAALEQNEASR